jgi:hypothetical protein
LTRHTDMKISYYADAPLSNGEYATSVRLGSARR